MHLAAVEGLSWLGMKRWRPSTGWFIVRGVAGFFSATMGSDDDGLVQHEQNIIGLAYAQIITQTSSNGLSPCRPLADPGEPPGSRHLVDLEQSLV